MSIHPTALVSPKASLGQNVSIGAYSIIEDGVEIDDNSSIGNHNSICTGTKIGTGCKIYHNNSIGEIPQDLKYDGEDTQTLIGNNVIIREFVTINRGTSAYGKTVVGNDVLLMACTHIAHDCIVGNNVIMANIATLGGHVEIGDWCNIGGGAMIHQFVKIGRQSLIGGGFSAKQDVPPFIIGAGIPLRFVGINKIGLERRKFSEEVRALIKKTYRTYFKSKLNRGDALKKIKNEISQIDEVKEIVNFIESSSRGII
ncbi:MAG: acyl-[acyl-carrier-protein]--UDP-N-acetylglucosamine O-acyltransferase [Candidatus Marinimicrobia bacterium]|nr:acyl-[acyl-carrier-protein]--UDP-N-acetylglucosamine O-acyltransferase [Candidatus Neomarinimicrobiota bacterium]